jgi:hypothetical protein
MSYSHSSHQQRTSISLLANVADHQERQYRRYIEQNETMGTGIAMRLARGEQFEGLLGKDVAEECREKLKVLATDNVAKERQLKAYVAAIRVVIENASNNNNSNNSNSNNESTAHEFKDQMETEYAKALTTIEKNSVLLTQEPSYLKLCRQLGEDQEEDDELAVVNDGAGERASGIKCPLTMAIMEDPVRSKVCHHSYARHAIVEHLTKNKSKKCPMPGCVNNNMTIAELEDDPETEMRVRRYKKRESATKKARAQSAIDMDMDDDEFELS